MISDEEKEQSPGGSWKTYSRSVSWTERPPRKSNSKPQWNSKARACLPPLQPLSIIRSSLEEWPKAGSDDLGIWPNPPTPGVSPGSATPRENSASDKHPREFDFRKDKLAFFEKECSRILDHIYLGSDAVAKNREILRQNGITHVLNCVGFVCPEYFKNELVYKTLWLHDCPSEDITSILYDVFGYFEDVREQGKRVLVHCCQGVSRSNSLVIAYLMWKVGMSFDDAFQHVKAARGVTNPNVGFARQLLQCQKQVHALHASPTSVLRMYPMAPHSPYDHGLGFPDSDTEEEVVNTSMFSGRRFGLDEVYMSDDSDYELPVDAQCHLMDKVGLAEGALHELNNEFQLYVSEEVRNKISILETNLVTENEKFASKIAKTDKHRRTQQERERKFDLQYQRTIAEALDNHLTAVQRDYEHISQLEEKRIRDDAAREEAKRKEKALIEEKIRQERIETEKKARLQAERAEMAEVVAEAEKQYVEEMKQAAVETLRNGVPMVLDYSKETLGQVAATGSVYLAERNMTRVSKNALELEDKRLQIYEKLTSENEAIKGSSNQGNRKTGQNFNRLIKTISATVENVRTKADELVNIMRSPEYPQSLNILSFAEKVVFNCENSQKSDGFIFSCSRVIVLVTSKIPLAMDILMAELNRVCIYTVPKFVEFSSVLFQTREAYFKAIGYKEIDGKIESTDSYVERLSSIMRLYGALVQTEIGGFQNLHGLKEGWAWLASFLNSLPANLYTAVALQHFLEMSGYALYRRYRNQFEKLLRIIAQDFLKALKEGNSDSVNAKLIKVKTSIINYIESSQFKKEPEGLQLRDNLDSTDFF
ncbi:mRNA export factor GLE1-like isoform X2 [Primulina eburnea]|uniref:mRNA export factor GLE1-like isoform X2 n=1 Tax=Primulina eburnea TaxID=1245227 RepID=UPI003C6CC026